MSHKLISLYIGDGEYYTRTDVDNVIAEKDAEIARLNAIRKVHVEAIESMGAGLLKDDKEIRHQKYKRCLAMAKWCDAQVEWYNSLNEDYSFWLELYVKWHNRWLEIAEKFKPNSTDQQGKGEAKC